MPASWKSRSLDRLQRALEARLVRSYTERFSGGVPERQFEIAERLAGHAFPKYWFSDFGRIWLDDIEFLRWYEGEEPANHHSADRKFTLRSLTQLVAHLPGDCAEFGVYRGASAELMGRAMPGRHLHLFDSFKGLSAPEPEDGSYWSRGDLLVPAEIVDRRLRSAGLPFTLYAGWIPERFDDVPADVRLAFAHIDVDLYRPTFDSLEFAYARLLSGGLIVFDDYGVEWCPGAKRAVDEFLADKPERVALLTTGQAFLQKL
jgi:hypothetical protein